MAMRKGLGKGLGALIEDFNEQPNTPGEGAVTLPLQKIEPNPLQPRKTFAEEEHVCIIHPPPQNSAYLHLLHIEFWVIL